MRHHILLFLVSRRDAGMVDKFVKAQVIFIDVGPHAGEEDIIVHDGFSQNINDPYF